MPKGNGVAANHSYVTPKSEPMPIAYRESGAMYFGEGKGEPLDRTGKTRFSVGPDDTGNAEEQRQFAETERAYGGRETYERTRSAGPTKLNYRQWVQVRTPAFKAWFGDWEALRAQTQLDAMPPVDIRVPDAWRGAPEAEMREKMVAALDDAVSRPTPIIHPLLGEIRVGKKGKDKSKNTSKDPAKMLVVADLANVLPKSIYAKSEAPKENEQGVDGYGTLLLPVNVDGLSLVARITVRHQPDGHWYYNAVALMDAQEKAQDSYGSPGTLARPLGWTPIAGLDSFVRRPLERVNLASVSKAVDPDTGEPMPIAYRESGAMYFGEGKGEPLDRTDRTRFSIQRTITVDGAERPTTNSEGRPIHQTEDGIRNFWRWYEQLQRERLDRAGQSGEGRGGVAEADSRNSARYLFDEQGRPRVFYHGTNADVAEFDLDHPGKWDHG